MFMNRKILSALLSVSLCTPICSGSAIAARPAQVELRPSDERVVVAVNQRTYAASGVFSSADCVFQFATDLRPTSNEHREYDRSLAGAAWLPGQVDKPVPVNILMQFLEGDEILISFAFDDAPLTDPKCAGRSTQSIVEDKGAGVQGVSLTRRSTVARLERDGALVDGPGLDRNDIVLMNYPEQSTAPDGYVLTALGYVLKEDLYPIMTADALREFYLREPR